MKQKITFLLSHICLPKPFLLVPQIPPIEGTARFSCNEPRGHLAPLWNPSPAVSWELVGLSPLQLISSQTPRPVKTWPPFSVYSLAQGTDFTGQHAPHSKRGTSH